MYSFTSGKYIPQEFLRILYEKIDDSLLFIEELPVNAVESVHNIRKNIKRIRALLRLVRPGLNPDLFTAENAAFRDIGRLLSDSRDSAVLLDTFRVVFMSSQDAPAELPIHPDLEQLAGDLEAKYQADYAALGRNQNLFNQLRTGFTERRAAWELPPLNLNFADLIAGLTQTYRAGRKDFMMVYTTDPSPRAFHEWRKQVKYLWHQHELLADLYIRQPDFEYSTFALDHLAGILGKAHDVAELEAWLSAHPAASTLTGLLREAQFSRIDFEGAARPHGGAIFVQKPGLKRAALQAS